MDNEVYERMCKKIAQLTRVIFVLNTKNDENDALIESIVDAYEKEIETLTKEASQVIGTMKKSVEKLKENMNIDEKVREINKKYDDSVYGFSLDYEKFKKESLKKERMMQDEYQEKYDKMWKDLSDLRKIYENKIGEINKKLEEDKKNFQIEKEILKNSFTKDNEETRKTFIDRINQINEDNRLKEEKIRQEFNYSKEKLIEEYEKKISDLTKLLDNNSSSNSKLFDDMKNEYEKKVRILKEEKENLEKLFSQSQKDIENLKNKISELEGLLTQKDKMIHDFNLENSNLNEKIKQLLTNSSNESTLLSIEISKLKEKSNEEKNIIENLSRQVIEKNKLIDVLEEEKNNLYQSLNNSRALADSDLSTKNSKIFQLENEIKM